MDKLGLSSRKRLGIPRNLIWVSAIAVVISIIVAQVWPTGVQAQDAFSSDLSSLRITDQSGAIVDIGTFDPAVTTYSASVDSTTERVTIRASASAQSWAEVFILPGDSPRVHGRRVQEVELSHGANLILVNVKQSPLRKQGLKTYSVTITRAGSAPDGAPTNVGISSPRWNAEGFPVPFLVTRTGDTSQSLTVQVDVTEDLDKLPSSSEGRFDVEFQAGHASARLNLPTKSDPADQGTSLVTAALVDGDTYDVDPWARAARIRVNENDRSGLEPTLASITLDDQNGTTIDIGTIDADTKTYSGSVGSEIEWITVASTTTHASTFRPQILPPDSRPDEAGHQVDLSHGVNLISIVVTYSHSGEHKGTYEVSVNRAGSPPDDAGTTISIDGFSRADEGSTLPFLLTRTGDTSQALTVPVNVSETGGEMVSPSSEGQFNVEFSAGNASAKFEVVTNRDHDWEEHSMVVVALVDGDGYEVSSESGSASVEVKDNDVPGVTAAFTVDSSQIEEGGEVTITVTVKTDEPKKPHSHVGSLIYTTEPGTAQDEDYELLFGTGTLVGITYSYTPNDDGSIDLAHLSIGKDTLQPVVSNGVITEYRHQFSFPILITNDDRPEPDETFDILLEWRHPIPPGSQTLSMDQGISSRTITIVEHEEIPETPDPASHIAVEIADSGSAGSTYTITWHDAGECTRDYRAYLTREGLPQFNPRTGVYEKGWTRYHTLGTTGRDATQLVKTLDEFPLTGQPVLRVHCGDIGRLVSEVPLPTKSENSIERPVAGTYSSEPALTGLTATPGTLGPAFNKYGFLYSVLDVAHANDQITLNATARTGYTISWNPSIDADPDTAGYQVDLALGYNSIFFSVDHDLGINSFVYEVIVKRAEAGPGQPPAFASSTYNFSVAEDSATGAAVGTVSATDPDNDSITYSFTAGNGDGKFAIDGSSGAVTTAGALDYESDSSYTLTVQAEDSNGGTATATVTISVTDVDEAPPAGPLTGFTLVDAADQSVLAALGHGASVPLAAPDTGSYGIRADVDSNATVGSVKLELSGGKSVGPRTENVAPYSLYGDDQNGEGRKLRGESLPVGSYTLKAEVYSERALGGDKLGTLEVDFTVTQANRAPEFGSSTYSFSIAEDAATGAALGTVSATDNDNDNLTYTIAAGNGDGKFAIDGSSGAVNTAGALDYETAPSYTLTVQADDSNGGTATTTVNINVTDVDEAPPAGPLTGFTLVDASDQSVLATLTGGASVALADTTGGSYGIRADVDSNATIGSVKLELSGDKTVGPRTENMAPYSLYGDTEVDGQRQLNSEALPVGSYTLKAEAYSERTLGGDKLGALEIAFTVSQANRPPEFGSASYDFSVAEDAASGAAVGTVSATDADNDSITYSITAGNGDGKFAIDASTGAITTAGALDYETDTSYALTVQADDSNGGTTTATVNINVTDVSEDPDGTREGAVSLGEQSPDNGRQFFLDKSLDRANGDRVDYYTFTTDARYTLGLGVRDQSINLDSWLEDADGNTIIQSGPPVDPNKDQTIEWLKTTIDAGTYYIRIEAMEDGRTDYYIRLGLETPEE